jgi:predicted nucleic acid-binding protein
MLVRSVLVDSGPLVALFNVRDRQYKNVDSKVAALAAENALLLTTWPCVTEATHMLRVLDNRLDLLAWLAQGGARVHDFDALDLNHMTNWMRRYSERREMDFADASLIWLAGELGATEILTIDRNDFERYRTPAGRPFRLL